VKRAVVLAAALACGCAAAPRPPEAARPAPIKPSALLTSDLWREWYSDHLTLDSDVEPATATTLLSEFERSVEAFDALFLPDLARSRGRLRVVLFARWRQYQALGPPNSGGVFVMHEPDDERNATIFMATRDSLRGTVVSFQHELAHGYVNASMPQAPTWLNEGIAELWQSLHPGDGDTRLGYLPPPLGDRDVDKLLRGNYRSFHRPDMQDANYGLAGTFTEFLWFDQHEPFLRYLHALAGGTAAATAWEQSFPQPVADAFERWYRALKRDGKGVTVEGYSFRTVEPLPPISVRPLTMAEMLRLFAALELERSQWSSLLRAATWAVTAVLFAPFDAEAYYWAGVYADFLPRGAAPAEAAYATALALQPDHVRALGGLAMERLQLRARVDDFSEVEPLVARISSRTTLIGPLVALAAYAHARGHDDDAFHYIRRALQASPGCTSCRLWLASLHNVRGETADADRELERALALRREMPPDIAASIRRAFAETRTSLPACDRGDAAACERLSDSYDAQHGVPGDFAVSLDLARRACDGKRAHACRRVAGELRRGIRPDPEKSTALMRHACLLGDWEACNDLGDAYEHGVGVAADVARAARMYRDACAHDSAWGCVSLASLAWRRLELPHDEAQIVDWIARSVKLDKSIVSAVASDCPTHSESCALAAIAWSRGLGVEKNSAYARDLMDLGCAAGDADACRAHSASN
jgi:TPR repeat protein